MSGLAARRGFLRSLAALPLVGGAVSILGNPTAAAEPITPAVLDAYSEWLFMERRLLCREMYPGHRGSDAFVPANTGARDYHIPPYPADWRDLPGPSTRAALVLSAVGCDWRRP